MTVTRPFMPRRTRAPGRVRYAPRPVRLRARRATIELASAIGHDFSQPLSTVTSLADLLAQDWAALPDDVRRDLARQIDSGARSLAARFGHVIVVMDALAGKVVAGKVVAGTVVPDDAVAVRRSVDAVVAALPAAVVVGVSGPPAPALMDREHLEHVLTTLIGDAMTFGAPPVRVRIVPEPGRVLIEIIDHGRVGLRQMRAHVRQTSTGRWTLIGRESMDSRALGLAVAARVVATGGGTIWQRPMRRHRGARVLIRLAAPVEPAR
jgi:K+-sensing histidine kinase KdpD